MPDKDLRRAVLDSGKTVSRRAKMRAESRESSRPNSTSNSRSASRNPSRHPSDEEDNGNLSDGTAWSINSIDELLAADEEKGEEDQDTLGWQTDLNDRIAEIIDRKRSSVEGRELCLSIYVRILTSHFTDKQISGRISDLLQAFGKSVKAESSEKETTLALKALALTIITHPESHHYGSISALLKRTITDTISLPTKAAAIHCLGVTTFFGGAGDEEIMETMELFLDIVSSDGESIGAGDDATSVTAALEEWGYLATKIEDLSAESEDMIEVFAEQLDSSDQGVQIAAGENIALLYEKSYSETSGSDSDDENETGNGADQPSFSDEEADEGEEFSYIITEDDDDHHIPGPKLKKRYNAYHHTPLLLTKLSSLATLSTHKISKKSKKNLHASFDSIHTTVENPRLGPRYQKATDQNTGRSYGSRMTVRIYKSGEMKVDRWWKWMRLSALRRVLQGGFVHHYHEGNMAVLDSLPILLMEKSQGLAPGMRSPRPKMKTRRTRGWDD